eukprot:TRINITY_DN963_c1_g1_i1.p3 TRINITY_DN963_c1_g1~~TRINITY_DN963_c1_g1_i1.p3  ORF type:complete len:125 (-),score=14.03 TRINITY_DN963_c1_g1_i1:39-413(-)
MAQASEGKEVAVTADADAAVAQLGRLVAVPAVGQCAAPRVDPKRVAPRGVAMPHGRVALAPPHLQVALPAHLLAVVAQLVRTAAVPPRRHQLEVRGVHPELVVACWVSVVVLHWPLVATAAVSN